MCAAARDEYVAQTAQWNELRRKCADEAPLDEATIDDAAKTLARAAPFLVEHDYQQDKYWPSWHASPQPGPTYFMSQPYSVHKKRR